MNILNIHMRILVAVFILIGCLSIAFGQQGNSSNIPEASTSAHQMKKSASVFINSLTRPQQDAIIYEFTPENLTNWSNTPPFVHKRPGLRLASLTNSQRQLAHELLRAALASQGYQKIIT